MASVLLLAVDSWGGVATMITLAEALRAEGVSSRIAAYSDFGDKVRAAGCDFVDLELSTADWWAEQNAQESDWARNPVKTWLAIRKSSKDGVRATVGRLADTVERGEGIVTGTLSVASATGIAKIRSSRVVAVNLAPLTPSRLPEASLTRVTRRPSRANEW